jgi:hypothetical protein
MDLDDFCEALKGALEGEEDYDPDILTEQIQSVDGISVEEPTLIQNPPNTYQAIRSTRVSFGGGELYDIYICQV